MKEAYKYDAFISYRHIEPDKTFAMKLQKYLEKYKAPKSSGTNVKKRINRIFRDESELVTSSDLGENIRNALEDSEYLIVICSEETLKSKWCMQEVSYFKELHHGKTDKILTLVVSGNPQDVFPEELCFEEKITQNASGVATVEKVRIEPLAASITAASFSKSRKKLKTEYLRLAAPLLGCGYDDLYKRHQRRFVRKLMTTFCTVIGIAAIFTTYVLQLNFKLDVTNTALNATNTKLDEKNEELDKTNKELESSNIRLTESEANLSESNENLKAKTREALNNYNNAVVQKKIAEDNERKANIQALKRTVLASESLMDEGDALGAFDLLDSLLASPEKITEGRAVTENFLTRALGIYNKHNITHKHNLTHPQMILEVKYAGNGETLVTKDASGIVYIWNVKDGNLINKIERKNYLDTDILKQNESMFDGLSVEAYLNDYYEGVCINKLTENEKHVQSDDFWLSDGSYISKYDGVSGNHLWSIESNEGRISFTDDYIAEITNSTLKLYDSHTGKLLRSFTVVNNPYTSSLTGEWIAFGENKAFFFTNYPEYKLVIFDIKDGLLEMSAVHNEFSELKEYWDNTVFGEIFSAGDEIAFIAEGGLYETKKIFVYDISSGRLKWSYECSGKEMVYNSFGKVCAEDSGSFCDISFFVAGERFIALNSENGELLSEINLDERIVNMHYYRNGYVFLITEEGNEYFISVRNRQSGDEQSGSAVDVYKFKDDIFLCDYSKNNYAIVYSTDNVVRLYEHEKNEAFEPVFTNESGYPVYDFVCNDVGTHMAIAKKETNGQYSIYIYNSKNKTSTKLVNDAAFKRMWFADNNTLMLAGDKTASSFDISTMKNKYAYKKSDAYATYECDNSVLFLTESFNLLYVDKNNNVKYIINKQSEEAYPDLKDSHVSRSCVSGRKNMIAFMATSDKVSLWIYNAETKKFSQIKIDGISKTANYQLDWINDNKLIIYSDSDFYIADTQKKSVSKKISYNGAAIRNVVGIGKKSLAVALLSDSTLCLLDTSSGKTVSTTDLKDVYVPFIGAVDAQLEYFPGLDAVIIKVHEQDMQNIGYVVDLKEFEIRSVIKGYCSYSKALDKFLISTEATAGTVTPHSLSDLVKKMQR